LKGQIKIGLADADLRDLAQTPDARKLSRADLAICMLQGATARPRSRRL